MNISYHTPHGATAQTKWSSSLTVLSVMLLFIQIKRLVTLWYTYEINFSAVVIYNKDQTLIHTTNLQKTPKYTITY